MTEPLSSRSEARISLLRVALLWFGLPILLSGGVAVEYLDEGTRWFLSYLAFAVLDAVVLGLIVLAILEAGKRHRG